MKLFKKCITAVVVSLFLIGAVSNVEAQDKRTAIKTYNKALESAQNGQLEQAINLFNQVMTQAENLGEEGKDILERSQKKLPQVHYQLALQKYKAFQSDQKLEKLDAAISQFRNTKDMAAKYNDQRRAKKAEGIVTKLMYSKALVYYKQQNYQDALATLDKVIERNANYAKAYYQKGIVMKKVDSKNIDDAIAQFDKAIEIAEKLGENGTATRAKESAHDQLVYQGAQDISNENFERATNLLNQALKYDSTSPDAYFRLAEAHNNLQNWQQAANNAKKGLDYEKGGKTEKAKIYFELATAYKGLGQKENACSAFSNAAYGSFKSPAEHQMEYELKCESATN
ncbi:tetratricopeptide repeat protein [Fodinibius halophilus]|uniref:Tetratricopeptide repeat protein n=1 Tax=Fodinibius halophilus TaxID=1736908 RepID=A0A6M1SZ19_9BACT|nr:tetratricopeptide repeat protein [Fodinibius halophilus]NGP86907.1 tetratricopeptide repeat protein [Fodinibius halophilus]